MVFASDNGPQGETIREMGNQGTPDMGNSGPFRGELGEATEGSIRTFAFIRWPGYVKPGTTSYAMFSIMDFFPTFARIIGGKMPTDRPIDGVDQTDVLLGKSETGQPRQPAELYRRGTGGGAVEAVARLLHRHASDRHRTAAPARAWARPALPWPGIRRSTTSRWTRTRISMLARCLGGTGGPAA